MRTHLTHPRSRPLLALLLPLALAACGGGTSSGGTGTDTSGGTSPTGTGTGSSGGASSGPATGTASGANTGATTGATAGTDTGDTGTGDTGTGGALCPDAALASDPFADCVVSFTPAGDASFGHDALPDVVLGPPRGGGMQGSLDVASLGCGGSMVLGFDGPGIGDGPGPDLLVFENPFALGDETFTEPARVAVSEDGVTWAEFPCVPSGDGTWPPTGCAGVGLVWANADDPNVDPTDPAMAGGDAFDLADVGLTRARYVRLVDVTAEHYGDATWCAGAPGGFDLDALAIVNEAPP